MQPCRNSRVCSVAISVSSGAGTSLTFAQRSIQPFLMSLIAKRQCLFKSFTATEALNYINQRGISLSFEVAEKITNLNPLLFSVIPPRNESIIVIKSKVEAHIVLYLRNLMLSMVQLNSMQNWLQSKLKETIGWIHMSTNNIPLTEQEVVDFHGSLVYHQGLCTLKEQPKVIDFNFPSVATLLLKELSKIIVNTKIPSNPIVNGFIFEENFLMKFIV